MRNPGGYAYVYTTPDPQWINLGNGWQRISGGVLERDTFTCTHCGDIEHTPVRPGPNDIGFCRYCFKRICQKCCDLPCTPYEKRLAAQESGIRDALDRRNALENYR